MKRFWGLITIFLGLGYPISAQEFTIGAKAPIITTSAIVVERLVGRDSIATCGWIRGNSGL